MDARAKTALIAVSALLVGDWFQSTFTGPGDSATERTIWGVVGALGAAYLITRIQ